jgi:hypothetical protein
LSQECTEFADVERYDSCKDGTLTETDRDRMDSPRSTVKPSQRKENEIVCDILLRMNLHNEDPTRKMSKGFVWDFLKEITIHLQVKEDGNDTACNDDDDDMNDLFFQIDELITGLQSNDDISAFVDSGNMSDNEEDGTTTAESDEVKTGPESAASDQADGNDQATIYHGKVCGHSVYVRMAPINKSATTTFISNSKRKVEKLDLRNKRYRAQCRLTRERCVLDDFLYKSVTSTNSICIITLTQERNHSNDAFTELLTKI